MEKVAHPEITGFGKATIRQGEIQGIWNGEIDNIMDEEMDQYESYVQFARELDFLAPEDQTILKKARKLLKQIDHSQTYRESRLRKFRRVFPEFVEVDNLRLFKKVANLEKRYNVEGFT